MNGNEKVLAREIYMAIGISLRYIRAKRLYVMNLFEPGPDNNYLHSANEYYNKKLGKEVYG